MKFSVYAQGKKVDGDMDFSHVETETIGVFETFIAYNGKVFREKEHLLRLLESAKTVGYKEKIDIPKLKREINLAVKAFDKPTAAIRLTLWDDQFFVMIGERKHAKSLYEKGVTLRTSPVRRSHTNAAAPEAKSTAFQNSVLATLEPKADHIYEWIFLDSNGLVTEVRIGNLFIVAREGRKQVLKTPPLPGILNGVTRRVVIECASRVGLLVQECPLTRHDLFTAQEAFLTNTTWELMPIRELDGRTIGKQVPGPYTVQLHQNYKQKVNQECRIRSSVAR